jgi:hypothetical protein
MSELPSDKPRPIRQQLQPPEPTMTDKMGTAARAAGAAALRLGLPIVGDVVSAIFAEKFPTAYQRRCAEWRAEVAVSLEELVSRGHNVEELREDDAFIDIVLEATIIAIRTSSARKRTCLRNAIITAGLPSPPTGVKQRLFLRLVDELDELHLQLLSFFESPGDFLRAQGKSLPVHNGPRGMAYDPGISNASLKRVLDLAFPEYTEQQEFLSIVIAELKRRGLIQREQLLISCMDGSQFTSSLGGEFLSFVRNPPSLSERV